MKKFYAILVAVVFVITAWAQPVKVQNGHVAPVRNNQQTLFTPAPAKVAMGHDMNSIAVRRAPQQTNAITNVEESQNSSISLADADTAITKVKVTQTSWGSLGDADFQWTCKDTTKTKYFGFVLYSLYEQQGESFNIETDSVVPFAMAEFAAYNFGTGGKTMKFEWSISNFLYNAYMITAQYGSQGYNWYLSTALNYTNGYVYLKEGKYVLQIWGDGETVDGTAPDVFTVFEITKSGKYDIKEFKAEPNADFTELTISWTNETMPEGGYYEVVVTQGKDTITSNYYTEEPIVPPVKIAMKEGKFYEVWVCPMQKIAIESNGKTYYDYKGLGLEVDSTMMFGVCKAEPENLQAISLQGEDVGKVELSWEAKEVSPYYAIVFAKGDTLLYFTYTDEDGDYQSPYYITNSMKDTLVLGGGTFSWAVVALDADGYQLSYFVDGPDFTLEDKLAPVVANARARVNRNDRSAYISVRANDETTPDELLVVELCDTTGVKVAEATLIDASKHLFAVRLYDLEEDATYTFCFIARDENGNETPKASRANITFKVQKVVPSEKDDAVENITIEGVTVTRQTVFNPNGISLQMFDAIGRELVRTNGDIDLTPMPTGMYILRSKDATMKIQKY